jgi:hypothetical protein
MGNLGYYVMGHFLIYTSHLVYLYVFWNQGGYSVPDVRFKWGRDKTQTDFCGKTEKKTVEWNLHIDLGDMFAISDLRVQNDGSYVQWR